MKCKSIKNISIAISSLILNACAGSRDVIGDFEMINSGKIPVERVAEFKDCVSDKFKDRTAGLDIIFFNRHQRRHNGYRVELVSTSSHGLLLSADIFDDGRTELHQRNSLVRNRLSDEREGFAKCLTQYGVSDKSPTS